MQIDCSNQNVKLFLQEQRAPSIIFKLLSLIHLALFLISVPYAFAVESNLKVGSIRVTYNSKANNLLVNWTRLTTISKTSIDIYDSRNQKVVSSVQFSNTAKFAAGYFRDGGVYSIRITPVAVNKNKLKSFRRKFRFSTKVRTEATFGQLKSQNIGGRNGTYFLPANYRFKPMPTMLLFHGSSIAGLNVALIFKKLAKKHNFIIIAPDSTDTRGWFYETDLKLKTGDQIHIETCLSELKQFPNLQIDPKHFMVAGISAGGELAAFYGSNEVRFSHLANLHGGIDLQSLGSNKVPVWLSTGSRDKLRPPSELFSYYLTLPSLGFDLVDYQEYDVAHEIPEQERADLVQWWLR